MDNYSNIQIKYFRHRSISVYQALYIKMTPSKSAYKIQMDHKQILTDRGIQGYSKTIFVSMISCFLESIIQCKLSPLVNL